jgi:hypothetical protein
VKALKFGSVAVSAGLLAGLLLGWHLGKILTGGQFILEEMTAAAGYGSLTLLQHEQADAQHARQALVSFTSFANNMSKLPSAKGDEALMIDTGRTFLRLAALEELAGNSSLSRQYVLSARETFKSFGRDIPEDLLNQQVAKMVASAQAGKRQDVN